MNKNCPTPKKVAYVSEKAAKDHLETIQSHKSVLQLKEKKPTRAYGCGCGNWHLTSKSQQEHETLIRQWEQQAIDSMPEITKAFCEHMALCPQCVAREECERKDYLRNKIDEIRGYQSKAEKRELRERQKQMSRVSRTRV